VGIDLSKGMLDQATRAVDAEGLVSVEVALVDAETLDYPNRRFDLVLRCSAPPISDIPAALRAPPRCSRAARPRRARRSTGSSPPTGSRRSYPIAAPSLIFTPATKNRT
jgi:hypothetical protein